MKGFTHWALAGVVVFFCAAHAGAGDRGRIGGDELVTGTLGDTNPTDTWVFHAAARQRILIDIAGTSGDLAPVAALLTVRNETLEDYSEYAEHQFAQDGDYKIVVGGAGSGDYALRLVNLQDCARIALACGDPCRADIDSAVDMDIYQFEGVVGQRVLLQLAGRAGFVPWLTLYPPDGGSWEAETSGLLEHRLLQSGIYTVVVYGDRDTTGSYDLCYVGGLHSGHGHPTVACTQSGALAWPADMHVYQFDVPDGQEVDVELAPGSNPNVCMHLFLLDYDLPLYPKAKVNAGSDFLPYTCRVPGTHTLVVYAQDLAKRGPFAYTITLTGQRTITVEAAQGGSVTPPPGAYSYSCGENFTATARADANYQFLHWTITPADGGQVREANEPDLAFAVDGDYTLTAHFALVQRTLDLSCTEGGSVLPAAGRHEYAHGTPVEITVVAEGDHVFQGWTGTAADGGKVTPGGKADTFTVIVDGDYTLQAHFGLAQRMLDLSCTEGGSVTPSAGPHSYEHGTAVEVTVTPAANYAFQGWTGTAVDAGKVKAGSGPQTFIVTVDSNYTLQARFAPVNHVLDLSCTEGGSVTPSAGRHEYAHGTAVAVTVAPGANYAFQGWTGTAVDAGKVTPAGKAGTFTVIVDGDYTLRADFVLVKRVLEISATTGGFVTPAPGRYEYDNGTTVEVTATSAGGYELQGWTGTAVEAGKARVEGHVVKITLDGNYTLEASFRPRRVAPQVRTLSVTSVTPESVSLQGELVDDGNDICVCWFRYGTESLEFETPKVSGKADGESFRQTITGLSCGTTYYYQAWAENSLQRRAGAVRRFTPVRLTVSADEGGTVSKPGLGVFFDHDPNTLAVRAEPAAGYRFWYWTGGAVEAGKIPGAGVTTPEVDVYVDANDTLRAMFLRTIAAWEDDVDRPGRRGVSFSTSQLWDFDAHDGNLTDVPADLYEVAGAAPKGRLPLPGAALGVVAQDGPVRQQWWPADPFAPTSRKGLLAATGLQARINVWQSHATATSVWVQVIWHPCEDAAPDLFPPEAPAKLALLDQDPLRLQFRLLAEEYLLYGWRRSTYAWDVAPSPTQIRFTLGGRVAIDSLIVDTYTEAPVAGAEIHVDDNASYDPAPGDTTIGDPFEDGTPPHPFDSIQEAIDAAPPGTTIIVHEGRYREAIHLPGKTLTLTAGWLVYPNVGAPSVLEAVGPGPAVRLSGREGANCVLSGLTITGGTAPGGSAILCQGGSPTISHCVLCGNLVPADGGALVVCQDSRARFINCTITDNSVGSNGAVFSLTDSEVVLRNSILWGNGGPVLDIVSGPGPAITYCDIEGGWPGLGVLNVDPRFAYPGYWHDVGTPGNPADDIWMPGDYHLQSSQGHFDPVQKLWIKDAASSACLDAGSPSAVWSQEPRPEGSRTNMGAYGGTTQAGKSSGSSPAGE